MDWYLMVWRKYAEFEGRSRRNEFWMFVLINLAIVFVLGGAAFVLAGTLELQGAGTFFVFLPVMIYVLAALIPNLAVATRRFHDVGKSGWLLLLLIVLGMIEIVFLCQDGEPGTNQYGPNPKFPEQAVGVFAGSSAFISMGLAAEPQPLAGAGSLGFCKTCGTKLTDGSPFCGSCGARI
jgi:uncharacterized membrane protein YhaH (DUF805 family)